VQNPDRKDVTNSAASIAHHSHRLQSSGLRDEKPQLSGVQREQGRLPIEVRHWHNVRHDRIRVRSWVC
jgi:hypothetical protein